MLREHDELQYCSAFYTSGVNSELSMIKRADCLDILSI